MVLLHRLPEGLEFLRFTFVVHKEKDWDTRFEHLCPQINNHVNIECFLVIAWII